MPEMATNPTKVAHASPRFLPGYSIKTQSDGFVFHDGSGKTPRFYQVNAINATIEAIAKGQDRIYNVTDLKTGTPQPRQDWATRICSSRHQLSWSASEECPFPAADQAFLISQTSRLRHLSKEIDLDEAFHASTSPANRSSSSRFASRSCWR